MVDPGRGRREYGDGPVFKRNISRTRKSKLSGRANTHACQSPPPRQAVIENPKAYRKMVKRKFYQPGLDPGALSLRERYCVRAAVLFAESFFQATTGINLHMYYSPEDQFPL